MSLNQRLQIWQRWKLHLIKLVNFQQHHKPLSFQFSGFEKAIRNMHLANAITKVVNKFCHKLLKQWVSNKLQILRKIPFVILQMHLDFLLSYLPSFKILKENKYRDIYSNNKHVPVGSPPPSGDKFVQKIVWFMCPPPLNFNAGAREIIFETSPVERRKLDVSVCCFLALCYGAFGHLSIICLCNDHLQVMKSEVDTS